MELEKYLQNSDKTHLIFDLDRTVARLEIDWSTFRRELFDTVGKIDRPLMESVPFEHGRGNELINKAVKKHGSVMKQALIAFTEEYETSHYHGYTANPDLVRFLRDNASGFSVFLWTNNCRRVADKVVSAEGIARAFTKVVAFEDVDCVKPEPDGFLRIRDNKTPRENYLFVGDSIFDETASAAAGLDFFKTEYFNRTH